MKLLLAALGLLMTVRCDGCSPTEAIVIQASQSKCEVSFDQPACNHYSFLNCKIMTCEFEGELCHLKTKANLAESECLASCCPGTTSTGNAYETFTGCSLTSVASQSPSSLQVMLIVMITIGSLVLMVILLGIIFQKCRKSRQVQVSNNPSQNPEDRSKKRKKQKAVDQSSHINLLELEWKNSERYPNNDYDCTICLVDSPNLKLECGHSFHAKCFFEWWQRKKQCGICRSTNIDKFILTCKRCHKRQLQFSLQHLKNVRGAVKQVCQDCGNK